MSKRGTVGDEFVKLVCGPVLGQAGRVKKLKQPRPPKFSHQWVDAMNLELSRRIASKIRREPELFGQAVKTLRHWKKIRRPAPPALLEWERILQRNSPEQVLALFTQPNEEGSRLRQSAPFCGILTERQADRLYREWCEQK